jgi:hypothetical protein
MPETNADLHPDLRSYVWDGWLHHPLIVRPLPLYIEKTNREYEENKARIAEAKRTGDWHTFVVWHERAYRFGALRKALRKIDDPGLAASLVGEVWQDSENIRQYCKAWISVWSALANPQAAMNDAERSALADLPSQITVFRGYAGRTRRGLAGGLSWTTSKDKAEWFAERFSPPGSPCFVGTGSVQKRDVLAYFTGRREEEVVVLPGRVQGIIYRQWLCRDRAMRSAAP